MNNQKQLGLGLLQYMQDYDESVPYNQTNGMRGFGGKVYPYIKSVDIFSCPNDPSIPPNGSVKVSYAASSNIGTLQGAGGGNNATAAIVDIKNPAKSIVLLEIVNPGQFIAATSFADGTADTPSSDGYGKPQPNYATAARPGGACLNDMGVAGGRPVNATTTAWATGADGRHAKGANYVMFDGHARWLPPGQVSLGRTQKLSSCNQDGGGGLISGNACAAPGTIGWAAGTEGLLPNGQQPAATTGIY